MELSRKLKTLRENKGITLEEAGKKIGTSRQTIFKYENGIVTNIPSDKIKLLAETYNVTPAYLMGWEEEKESLVNLPVYSSIACGKPCMVMESVEYYKMTPKSWLNGGEYFYLIAKGDSMIGSRIHEGDVLLIRRQPDVEEGEIAAVVVDDECTLKKVYHHNGSLVLQADNPKYPPIVLKKGEVRIIGKLKKIIIEL